MTVSSSASFSGCCPRQPGCPRETADDKIRTNSDLIWLVDPIDGTRDFVRGRTGWAVSVALVSAGRPLIGMLARTGARRGMGCQWQDRGRRSTGGRSRPAAAPHFRGARVPAHSLPKDDADLVAVDQPNSIALRIAMVADDRADLVATLRWGFEWDIAAATLIAREAGAEVSDAFGHPLAYNKHDPRDFGGAGMLACNSRRSR